MKIGHNSRSLFTGSLPASMQDIADTFGLGMVISLVDQFGGLELRIPKTLSDDHQLMKLGRLQAQMLCDYCGGGETIHVPLTLDRKRLKRQVDDLEAKGWKRQKIARETLFDEDAILGPRIIEAASRMISATKRKSQQSAIRIGVNMQRDVEILPVAQTIQISQPSGDALRPTSFKQSIVFRPISAALTMVRPMGEATRASQFKSNIAATSGVSVLQIHKFTAQAA